MKSKLIGKINLNLTGSIDKVFNLVQNLLVQFQNNYQRWYNLKEILHVILHKVYVDETNHFKCTKIGSINQFTYKDFKYLTWCSYTVKKKRWKWIWTKTGHEYVHTKQYCNLVCYITLRDINFRRLLRNYCNIKNEVW